jgi:SpoIID/LytB domain protein
LVKGDDVSRPVGLSPLLLPIAQRAPHLPLARRLLVALAVTLAVAAALPHSAIQATATHQLTPVADAWVNRTRPNRNYGRALVLRAASTAQALLRFDTSAWFGLSVGSLELTLPGFSGDPGGLSLDLAGNAWRERSVTWRSRPPTLRTLEVAIGQAEAPDSLALELTDLFPSGTVDRNRVTLRVRSSSSSVAFSSREGTTAPTLTLVPPPPLQSPTPSPTSTPSATPSPSQQPGPVLDECGLPLFYLSGHGTDHGAGMSQWGARGRAAAGQTYDQILNFYYTDIQLSSIDGSTPIKVLLGDSFVPTPDNPARIAGYIGGWQSAAFPGMTFAEGSYVVLWPTSPPPSPSPTPSPSPSPSPSPTPTPDPCAMPGSQPTPTPNPSPSPSPNPSPLPAVWTATAYDSTGNVLASSQTSDLTIEPLDPATGVLDMSYRDNRPNYELYRGSMRVIVTPTGLQTINILPLESYLRSVVPAEMPATWPIEALKAQAVAARSYAWARMKPTKTWDVRPTADNQVYLGYQHERAQSDSAVAATANQVLTYQGSVISALFHSDAGGYTENSEYAFPSKSGDPGNRIAYLRGKPDVDPNGVPYDIDAPAYAWQSGEFNMRQLSVIFSSSPLTDVGMIDNITVWRGVSGRVYKVLLEGSEGSKTISGGVFENVYNANTFSGPNLKSTMFFLTAATSSP